MKILKLLNEGKFSKSKYAYHATKAQNLPSILKHGLIPNKMGGGYGSDENSAFGYSLSPLKGVYFTRSYLDAKAIAKSFMCDAIVVICKIQQKSAELDEDRMGGNFILDEDELYRQIRLFIRNKDLETEISYDVIDFSQKYAQELIKDKMGDLDSRLLANVYTTLVNYIKTVIDYCIDEELNGYSGNESDVKKAQNELTKKLRLMLKNESVSKTFKIDQTIGYSGANKIVGFFNNNTDSGWGDCGQLGPYHLYDNPIKILAKPVTNADKWFVNRHKYGPSEPPKDFES